MNTCTRTTRHGFTLVEVLVAVAILIIGVIAALRIFPAGFSAYDKSQYATTALKLVKQKINGFLENPDSLPDAILPVDMDDADPEFAFDDLSSVDFRTIPPLWNSTATYAPGDVVLYTDPLSGKMKTYTCIAASTGDFPTDATYWDLLPDGYEHWDWYAKHLYPTGTTAAQWPLWQPKSARVLRRIVGEKVQIPSEVRSIVIGSVVSASTTPTNTIDVAIDANFPNTLDTIKVGTTILVDQGGTIAVFTVAGVTLPSTLEVNEDVSALNVGDTILAGESKVPKYLPNFGPVMRTGSVDPVTKKFTTPAGMAPLTIYDIRYQKVSSLSFLPSTEKYYYTLEYDASNTRNIITLPDDTYDRALRVNLFCINTSTNQIVQLRQEDTTWKLQSDGTVTPGTIEAGSVNIGLTYSVSAGNPSVLYLTFPDANWRVLEGSEQLNRAFIYADSTSSFNPFNLPRGYYYFDSPSGGSAETDGILTGAIYFSRADAGRKVKIDYIAADWNILHEDVAVGEDGHLSLALSGLKAQFKPRYPREAKTWGLYKPMESGQNAVIAAVVDLRTGVMYYIETNNPAAATPTYSVVSTSTGTPLSSDPEIVAIDAPRGRVRLGRGTNASPDWTALRGSTFRVFYRAQSDWTVQTFRAPSTFWYKGNSGDPGWQGFTCQFDGTNSVITVHPVYAGHTIAVDYFKKANGERVSGELHTVSTSDTHKGTFWLSHEADTTKPVYLRGQSVTVRAMWSQNRPGDAYTYSLPTAASLTRTINERWQSKALTVTMPTVKE